VRGADAPCGDVATVESVDNVDCGGRGSSSGVVLVLVARFSARGCARFAASGGVQSVALGPSAVSCTRASGWLQASV